MIRGKVGFRPCTQTALAAGLLEPLEIALVLLGVTPGLYRSISGLHFVEWREVVQCPIYQQLRQHGQLLDCQGDIATRTFKITGKVGAHDVERGEGFAGVGEQGRRVDVGAEGEDVADGVEVIGVAEAGADGGFGGFGEVG